jgi:hypothetical protein
MSVTTVKHPRCFDIRITRSKIHDQEKHILLNTQYNGKLSSNTQRILKKIQHRSYYRVLNFLSLIPNQIERNFLIQTLNSVGACLQNNYDANIVKIWVENVSIQKQLTPNSLINSYHKNVNMKISYFILIDVAVTTKLMTEN